MPEQIVRRVAEDLIDDPRNRGPIRWAEPQAVLERCDRRRVGDEIAGELYLLDEALLLERKVRFEHTGLDARRAREPQVGTRRPRAGPGCGPPAPRAR